MARLILIKSIRALLTVMICVTFVFIILRVAGDPVRSLTRPPPFSTNTGSALALIGHWLSNI
jgi:ABC-type dipeptide/oligopeptide/nickel transport system permease component